MKMVKNLFKIPSFVFGISLFGAVVLFAVLGPWIFDLNPFDMQAEPFLEPDGEFWLGTNHMGQDVFSRLIYGLRTSLYVGLAAGLLGTFIGTFVGLIGGYKGGLVDNVLTVLTNLLLVIPQLVILILIANSFRAPNMGGGDGVEFSYLHIALIIGATSWTWVARAVAAQASSLARRDHVNLAKLNGFGTINIVLRQVLPYILSYIFMAFIMQLSAGILSESALSMLGLGPQTSDAVSLGQMLNDAQKNEALTDGYWWVFIPPTLMITFIAFSLYVVNTAMEGVFNPRLRK
jgi:peptide/nickel transport system permease protein